MRIALGASRWQLVRPMLVESAILSAAGGLIGLALAYGGLRVINAVASEPFMRQLGIDGNVLAFTAALSILTPLVFTVWPALTASRAVAGEMLHGARTSGGRAAGRRRHVLIGAQVALALSLLVLSALVTQSMRYLRHVDPGFEFASLLTYRFDLPEARYPDAGSRAAFVRTLEARLAGLPGVDVAAVATHMPVIEGDQARVLTGTRHDGATEQDRPWASWFAVTSGFFAAAGIEVVAGRPLQAIDRDGAEPVAVLNRLAADRYFDGTANAVGRRVVIHDALRGERPVTIVGVVADTRDAQLTRTSPQIFVPIDQWPAASLRALVRAPDPLQPARDVQAVMRALDPDIAVANLKPMAAIIDEELSSSRIVNGLLVGYAVLALALAAGGLFGVISYSVGQRRREIGVRLALGASPRRIARMIVREGLIVTAIGAAAGLVIASVLAQFSASVLFGVSPRDPATFGGVLAVILLVALAASWVPAARAMRVDPAGTLRAE
jgi:predicted permease